MLLMLWECTGHSVADSSQSLPETAITAPLDSLFSSHFISDGPSGIVMVMRDDTLVYRHAFGYADIEKRIRISDSTLFNLASASKIFSVVALLRLAEQGHLNLDDSLSKFFPEFPCRFFDRITIRNILTNSSGLPDIRPRNKKEWSDYRIAHKSVFGFGNDYRLYGSENEHMQIFVNLDSVDFAPGTHYQSNDPAYILVVPLIERVTGREFDDWMDENIFAPAGISNIFYLNPGKHMPETAHGYRTAEPGSKLKSYRSGDGKWEEYDYGEAEFFLTKADRGVYSSARDFIKWKQALYNGKFISDSSIRAISIPGIPTDIGTVSYGLGTGVLTEPGFPTKTYHINANGGFAIIEGSWSDAKIYYIVFSNRNDWDRRAVTVSLDSIFKAKGWI